MHCAVLVFPGSNCDRDTIKALELTLGATVDAVWHQVRDLAAYDAIVVPGGFSYGDYLRCGAIANQSPVMGAVKKAAEDGKLVLGICNGFQVLTEARLLPGALLRNNCQEFRCEISRVEVVNSETPFTSEYEAGETLRLPIAHGEGRYFVDPRTLAHMQENNQIVFRYPEGENPNGSVDNIAGVCNERGNVLGMMPHPERAMRDILGSSDGANLFSSMTRELVNA